MSTNDAYQLADEFLARIDEVAHLMDPDLADFLRDPLTYFHHHHRYWQDRLDVAWGALVEAEITMHNVHPFID